MIAINHQICAVNIYFVSPNSYLIVSQHITFLIFHRKSGFLWLLHSKMIKALLKTYWLHESWQLQHSIEYKICIIHSRAFLAFNRIKESLKNTCFVVIEFLGPYVFWWSALHSIEFEKSVYRIASIYTSSWIVRALE